LVVFLMANVITSPPERLERMLAKQEASASPNPGYGFFTTFTTYSNQVIAATGQAKAPAPRPTLLGAASARAVIIAAHLMLLAGMVWIGFRHFDNIQTGAAAATLYLLTFYTSQFTSQVDHVAPAMLLVWAVAAYRRPMIAGVLLGLAGGIIFYPLFLVPLWCAFYWRRGLVRFVLGVAIILAILVGSLAPSTSDVAVFTSHVQEMFGLRNPMAAKLSGFWQFYDPVFRYPMLAGFVVLCGSLAIWPAQKSLATLLSCSAAVMLAAQFWVANQGGLYMAWYLPLLILTVFRPNLEDRMALSAVRPVWRKKG
jgi:hypothetical protein